MVSSSDIAFLTYGVVGGGFAPAAAGVSSIGSLAIGCGGELEGLIGETSLEVGLGGDFGGS